MAILVRDVSTRMMGGWRANFGFICKVREEGFVGEFFGFFFGVDILAPFGQLLTRRFGRFVVYQ